MTITVTGSTGTELVCALSEELGTPVTCHALSMEEMRERQGVAPKMIDSFLARDYREHFIDRTG